MVLGDKEPQKHIKIDFYHFCKFSKINETIILWVFKIYFFLHYFYNPFKDKKINDDQLQHFNHRCRPSLR